MSNKFICIHGHFYQPPRENPWLEEVELQESARPYHDWNARITAECYARNGASRILDPDGRINEIVNNYSKISFNIGPTLLSWMENNDPDAYRAILEADKLSQQRFSGHGGALAQVYNHIIMPLASTRDKRTQVIWGIRDFESRYHRKPEGMWLAETAVDLESLDIMAEQGIKFTVLAPHQARRVKKLTEKRTWDPADEEHIDLRRPYLCKLPSGRAIAIFFYDGPVSRAVAFEGVLHNGETFANRLFGAFDRSRTENQLVHIATDGESYGHHHTFGDMGLAYALKHIEEHDRAKLTVYGNYLELNPPEYEVEIIENSSWSCMHGVERWRDNCGCNSGGKPGWQQEWRAPLRKALDLLRDRAAKIYEREMSGYGIDPWALRDAYIEVILDRSRTNMESFLFRYFGRDLPGVDKNKILRCLEIQRNALLMYTSCGWFFDDISGIETVQIIKYAARVIQLVRRVCDEDIELAFLEALGKAKSNVAEANNGARIYKLYVEPSIVDILRVGAHYAMSSLYEDFAEEAKLYCFTVRRKIYERQDIGKMTLVVGRCEIISEVTWTAFEVHFALLHLGDHNFICGVDYYKDDALFERLRREVTVIFNEGDVPRAIQAISRYFGTKNYSLWHLFKYEQQMILDRIFENTMGEVETSFRRIYEDHFSLIRMLHENNIPLPKTLGSVAEFVLNCDLSRILSRQEPSLEDLERLAKEIRRWPFKRDKENLDFLASRRVNEMMASFYETPEDVVFLERSVQMIRLLLELRIDIDFWKAQNIFYGLAQTLHRAKRAQVDAHGPEAEAAKRWLNAFYALGELLKVKVV
jgi:alpha-amylase/alpha-mannosidase (GH57 family)